MRSAIGKTLRKEFSRALQERLPQFLEARLENNCLGDRLYVWQTHANLSCFVLLRPRLMLEEFSVIVGWSRDGRWHPETDHWRDPADYRADTIAGWFDIGALAGEPNGWKRWVLSRQMTDEEFASLAPNAFAARLADESYVSRGVSAVAAAVSDAVTWIERFGMPYFNGLVTSAASGR